MGSHIAQRRFFGAPGLAWAAARLDRRGGGAGGASAVPAVGFEMTRPVSASMPPGEAAHHRALAPAEVRGADGRVVTMAFDPEGEVAYYHEPHEAGGPNYAVLGPTGFGDRGTFYGWLKDTLGWVTSPARPLSPAPVASHFASADAFRAEQARWFHDHGDGCELQGSRADQNRLFDRLRDKLLGYRRHRASAAR